MVTQTMTADISPAFKRSILHKAPLTEIVNNNKDPLSPLALGLDPPNLACHKNIAERTLTN